MHLYVVISESMRPKGRLSSKCNAANLSRSHLCTSHFLMYKLCYVHWFPCLPLLVCGSSKLPATAVEYLVWESARAKTTDHCCQTAGGVGCGHGTSCFSAGLLDHSLQQSISQTLLIICPRTPVQLCSHPLPVLVHFRLGKSCEAPSWSSWPMRLPLQSSWGFSSWMLLTALEEQLCCPTWPIISTQRDGPAPTPCSCTVWPPRPSPGWKSSYCHGSWVRAVEASLEKTLTSVHVNGLILW